MKFEPAVASHPALFGSLGRLDRALFLVFVDSVHAALESERGGFIPPVPSTLPVPNQ
jgi:hypothetical protein